MALSVNRRRLSSVSDASEKAPDHVQPPTEISTLNPGWVLRESGQHRKVLGVVFEPLDDAAVVDVGKRVVHVRQLVRGDLGGIDHLLAGEHVADHHV